MAKHRVIRPFVDRESGERVDAGAEVELSQARARALRTAGVLRPETADAPEPETADAPKPKRRGKKR